MLLAVSQSLADVNTAATYAPDERLLKLVAPFWVAAGDSLARPSGRPDGRANESPAATQNGATSFRRRSSGAYVAAVLTSANDCETANNIRHGEQPVERRFSP